MSQANYFTQQGRKLLANGYLIIPIKQGEKRPLMSNWNNARLGATDLPRYAGYGVGVITGQGACPVIAVDIDVKHEALANQVVEWCETHIGITVSRVGDAPKILLVYRIESDDVHKVSSANFSDGSYHRHHVEVLANGQQFVAYHTHKDTGLPYEWTDFFGGLESMPVSDLPVINKTQIADLLTFYEQAAQDAGLTLVTPAVSKAPQLPKERTQLAEDDFFGRVNQAAIDSLHSWVPILFPQAREYNGGFRVSSVDLGRDLEEDLSLLPQGIVDFGIADMGDSRQGKRSPIDVVLEWSVTSFDDPLDAPLNAFDAAIWLCECLEVSRESLGFGLKKTQEKISKRVKQRKQCEDVKLRIAECDDSVSLINNIAKEAGLAVSEDIALRAELAGLIQGRFKIITGTAIPVADIRVAMSGSKKAVSPLNKERHHHTEFGNAGRLLDAYGEGLMYVPEVTAWYCWNTVYWKRSSGVEIEQFAKETVKALPDEAKKITSDAERADFLQFCAASQRAIMVKNMISLAQSDPRVVCSIDQLDKDNYLLGCANGAVDLRTGELLTPSQEQRITYSTGHEYDPSVNCPVFRQTVLDAFFGDTEMASFFQRVIGYIALGQPVENLILIPHGSGSNGKSTIFKTLSLALGDYAKTANADSFLSDGGKSNAGGAREDVLRLRGARYVYSTEPDEGKELREGLIKAMTGGEALPARAVYGKHTVEVQPTWTIVMPTNHKPIIKGDDHGIWRRILLIPFTRNYDDDVTIIKDVGRSAKLMAELPGVLRWIVEGALAYQKDGLNPPNKVKQAKEEYKSDMDLLGDWLNECCELGDFREENAKLWSSWESFAKSRGELKLIPTARHLTRRLAARFANFKGTGGKRGFNGLRVVESADFADLESEK